jgi:hypothetical protein
MDVLGELSSFMGVAQEVANHSTDCADNLDWNVPP